ncbi:MAG: UvrB/UvrC motif-containing protein [Bacillota bacterium]|jgi:protein arginine kinase activator
MMCEDCGKSPAMVHFEQMVNGKKIVMNLCRECAEKRGVLSYFLQPSFSINNLLSALLGSQMKSAAIPEVAGEEHRCPVCGMGYRDFARAGRLGCSRCYATFQDRLEPLLRRIHGSERHVGKAPALAGEAAQYRRELEQLRKDQAAAIAAEDYEKAAVLRDRIKAVEKKLRGDKS